VVHTCNAVVAKSAKDLQPLRATGTIEAGMGETLKFSLRFM